MNLLIIIINPPCNIVIATLFNRHDERKKNQKVAVKGGSKAHVLRSGSVPDFLGASLGDQYPLDLPMLHEAVGEVGAMSRVEEEGTEPDEESEIVSSDGHFPNVVGCQTEGVIFEEAIGRARLLSETDTVVDTAAQPVC